MKIIQLFHSKENDNYNKWKDIIILYNKADHLEGREKNVYVRT